MFNEAKAIKGKKVAKTRQSKRLKAIMWKPIKMNGKIEPLKFTNWHYMRMVNYLKRFEE